MRVLLFLSLCIGALLQAQAQTWPVSFNKVFNGKLLQTYDGGYVMMVLDEKGNTFLFKLDVNGKLLWKKKLGQANESWEAYDLIEVNNKLVLSGRVWTINRDEPDHFVLQLDECFNLIWVKVLRLDSYNQRAPLIGLTDSTFALISDGEDYRDTAHIEPNQTSYIYKFNTRGEVLARKRLIDKLHVSTAIYGANRFGHTLAIVGNAYYPWPGSADKDFVYSRAFVTLLDTDFNTLFYYNNDGNGYFNSYLSITSVENQTFYFTSVGSLEEPTQEFQYSQKNTITSDTQLVFKPGVKAPRDIYPFKLLGSPLLVFNDSTLVLPITNEKSGSIREVGLEFYNLNFDSVRGRWFPELPIGNYNLTDLIKLEDGNLLMAITSYTTPYQTLLLKLDGSTLAFAPFDSTDLAYDSLCDSTITSGDLPITQYDTIYYAPKGTPNGNNGLNPINYQGFLVSIYPVPAQDVLHINTAEHLAGYAIFDVMGKQVQTGHFSQAPLEISTANLPNGLYTLVLFNGKQLQTTKRFTIHK